MKKAIAAILLSVFMLSFSELPQLLKIPVFVQHFNEHKALDEGTTFWGFVREHYQGKFIVDDDFQRDNQLPFRTTNFVLNTTVIIAPPVPIEMPVALIPVLREFGMYDEDNSPVSSLQDIFQPPRLS